MKLIKNLIKLMNINLKHKIKKLNQKIKKKN